MPYINSISSSGGGGGGIPTVFEGKTYYQDNRSGNAPDPLVDPTTPSPAVAGDATLQRYDDIRVISVFDGSTWSNVEVASDSGQSYYQDNTSQNLPATLVDPTTPNPLPGTSVIQEYADATVLSSFDGTSWWNVSFKGVDSDPVHFPGDNGPSIANKVNAYLDGETIGPAPLVSDNDLYTTATFSGGAFTGARDYIAIAGAWLEIVPSTETYSSAEHSTGKVWIDGKPIFRQVVSTQLATGGARVRTPLKTDSGADMPDIGYMDTMVPSTSFMSRNSAGTEHIFDSGNAYVGVDDFGGFKHAFYDPLNNLDRSDLTATWIIEYTKV